MRGQKMLALGVILSCFWANSASAQSRTAARGEAVPSGVVVVEYEAAYGTQFVFRSDRAITGVWQAKGEPATAVAGPDFIVTDENYCLYGCTGSVWQPLDCPGRNFLVDDNAPDSFKIFAPVQSGRSPATTWRWIDPTSRGMTQTNGEAVLAGRFVLANQDSRPPSDIGASDSDRAPKLECWVDENPNGMFPKIRCCYVGFETLPTDPAPKPGLMNVPDTQLCTSQRVPAQPDVDRGSIVLRTADGRELCLNPDFSFGACASTAVDRGIKEKGIR